MPAVAPILKLAGLAAFIAGCARLHTRWVDSAGLIHENDADHPAGFTAIPDMPDLPLGRTDLGGGAERGGITIWNIGAVMQNGIVECGGANAGCWNPQTREITYNGKPNVLGHEMEHALLDLGDIARPWIDQLQAMKRVSDARG